jgi:serine/threonine protein kinase
VATAPNIASLVGAAFSEAPSTGTAHSTWGEDTASPTGAGPATQLHLLSLRQTSPVAPVPGDADAPTHASDEPRDTPVLRGRRPLREAGERYIELPEHIGPFRLGRELARGGMSQVVEAWDVDRRRTVALKVMRPSGSGRRAEREAWDREIAILRAMQHPGVVPLVDYGIGEGGELYLAMPLLEGRSARDELVAMRRAGGAAQTATTYDVLLPAFLDICDTLEHVHASGVLHCDLKPGNIFLSRARGASRGLLLDWGVSVIRDPDRPRGEGGRPGGTPGYMAPEQITGRISDLGPRTDVYGLGCLLYEFVAWRPVIRRGEPRRALRDALRGNLLRPEQRQSEVAVPTAVSDVCMKALESNPADRYPSAAALARAIRTLIGA